MNVKKIIGAVTIAAIVSTSVIIPNVSASEVTVKLDGEVVECPTPARVENGSTMIPMRAIFEAFGMDVTWNDEEKSVTATKGEDTVKLTVGGNVIEVNGEKIELTVAPYIDDGSTLVPVRAVSEGLNAKVSWNGYTKQVDIVTDNYNADSDAWKENTGVINLSDLTYSGEGVLVDGNVIVITDGGDFEVTGENSDAMIYVNAIEKVKLRLNGVNLTNNDGPAIFFDNCEKALITISKGSENFLTDGREYSADAKATIFANDDIEIKGEGTLTVTSKTHHAIASDDDIKIEEGTIIINAEEKDGIHANNTIKILGGDINITSKGDGIQSEEDIIIENGNVNVTTTGTVTNTQNNMDGGFGGGGRGGNRQWQQGENTQTDANAQRENNRTEKMARPENGENMTPPENAQTGEMPQMGEMPQGGFGGGMPMGDMTPPEGMENMTPPENMGDMTPPENMGGMTPPENGGQMQGNMPQENTTQEEDNTTTTKGIKAETDITISGGTIVVNSADDAMHCSGTVNINGGEITLTSDKGKGISAHGELAINDGTITVKKATEGVECKTNLTISGGTISITASDDGINAGGTGARDVSANAGHDLVINGGTIYVNASADGLDANGSITINGGDIVVNGPTNNGNGALDSGASIIMNGGTLIALGASGMAEAPGNSSTQPSFRVVTASNYTQGTVITIANEKGEVIYSYTAEKSGNSIVFSSDKLTIGETYTVKAGEEETSVTLTSVSTGGSSNMMGGFGGGGKQRW